MTAVTSCLITTPTEVREVAPVTPPRILDLQGTTRPRLGNLLVLTEGDPPLLFEVPVEDDNVNDRLQSQFFLNNNRDCVPIQGGASCEPNDRVREIDPNGQRVRTVRKEFRVEDFRIGCNRVELWVSSRFRLSGNFHTPDRPGDFDFASWWVFVRPRPGSGGGEGDGAVIDPVERCAYAVQP